MNEKVGGWKRGKVVKGLAVMRANRRFEALRRKKAYLVAVVDSLPRTELPTDCVLYLRTSGRSPHQLAEMAVSEREARVKSSRRGYRVAAVFTETRCGRRVDRPKLLGAIEAARELGCPLVVENLSRLLRHPSGDGRLPTPEQVEELSALLAGVKVYALTNVLVPYEMMARDRVRSRLAAARLSVRRTGPKGPRLAEAEKAAILERFESRECSAREFAREVGVGLATLYLWRGKRVSVGRSN